MSAEKIDAPTVLKPAVDLKTAHAMTKIPISTLRQWISEGRLPAYKIGHHVRVFEDDLLAMFRRIGA